VSGGRKNSFQNQAPDERIAQARTRAQKLVDHIATLFLMHEANAVVIYSQTLADQIPRSCAAHAFNQFQRSMHLFEIVRLCALWDPPGSDRESIPNSMHKKISGNTYARTFSRAASLIATMTSLRLALTLGPLSPPKPAASLQSLHATGSNGKVLKATGIRTSIACAREITYRANILVFCFLS
jgi:hypothetical protein